MAGPGRACDAEAVGDLSSILVDCEFVLGAVFNREWVSGSSSADRSGEALVAVQYQHFERARRSPTIGIVLATFSNFTGESRFRVQATFRLNWSLLRNLSYQIDIRNWYDSRPPTPEADKNNLSIVSSLAYTF